MELAKLISLALLLWPTVADVAEVDTCEAEGGCDDTGFAQLRATIARQQHVGTAEREMCDPTTTTQQFCQNGNPCPDCGTQSCDCNTAPSPEPPSPQPPSPQPPSPDGQYCGRTGEICSSDELCIGTYHSWSCEPMQFCGNTFQKCTQDAPVCVGGYKSWGCVGNCANNMACQAPEGDWDGCNTCGDRLAWLLRQGGDSSWDEALAQVAEEFPSECGCLG